MRDKFIRFMYGRYGMDSLSRFLIFFGLGMMLITSFFLGAIIGQSLYFLSVGIAIYGYYRVFSKKVQKRYNENLMFLDKTRKIRGLFGKYKSRIRYMKTHHIYSCPNCKQKIRIPRGKGKIEIRCPKCRASFVKKS